MQVLAHSHMKSFYRFTLLGLLPIFTCIFLAAAQNTGGISGIVLDARTKKPLSGATVLVTEAGLQSLADEDGRFRIRNIRPGSYSVTVSATGYEQQVSYNIPISSGNENELSFELEPSYRSGSELVLRSVRLTARAGSLQTPLSVQRLTSEEIKSNPGGNFDISRVINSLPGVGGSSGTVGGFRNDIIIRGGGPGENVFYLDGIEVPVINHFATQGSGGGPTGILNVSFIEDVRLSTSAFDARYDNALSSVFEFKQKTGNSSRTQGNVRLSGTELAGTLEGPMNNKGNLTYLASIRRSYLQLLFSAIDLPLRPNYWDFQYKLTYKPDQKSTLTFLAIGAIDEFGYGPVKEATQDKLYTLAQVPSIEQRSYTFGASYNRSIRDGFLRVSLSRNTLMNQNEKYDENDESDPMNLRFRTDARETENKLRIDINQNRKGWTYSYGLSAQYAEYETDNNIRRRAAVGGQPEDRILFSGDINFFRFGAFAQAGRTLFNDLLSVNLGLRTDINTFSDDGTNPGNAFSPRVSLSYQLANRWKLNASVGRYARLAPYTVLGFRDNTGKLVNTNNDYIRNIHYVAGVEFLPRATTRFTVEGFFKKYDRVPVTVNDGISINNLGADFATVGNEAVTPTGTGESYGVEFFAQQKLSKRFFGIFSYTYFVSRFSNRDGILRASAWDNRHLVSATLGYKFPRNWELGLKYRYQGGAPYTPFDMAASQLNYPTLAQGILDYSRFNSLRLRSFMSSDVRIDKKWNLRGVTIDLYLDVSNWFLAKSVAYPQFSFERDLSTGAYKTTDGLPLRMDGSNGVPIVLKNDDPVVLPTLGFIVEF